MIVCCYLLAASCTTHMKITVDIFDRAALVNSMEHKSVKAEDQPSCSVLTAWRSRFISDGTEIVRKVKDAEINDTTVELYARSFAENIITLGTRDGCQENVLNLIAIKVVYANALDLLADELGVAKEGNAAKAAIFEEKMAAFSKDADGLFGTSIAKDKMASFVVKAPEYCWQRYDSKVDVIGLDPSKKQNKEKRPAQINSTIVNTFFGNADIAIKMETPGYFVVKGVRLDANEAIKSSFKVLNQGIKYLSYASGIPVPAPATPASNTTNYVNKLPEIVENDTLSLQMDVRDAMYKQEIKSLLSIILSQKQILTSGTDSAAQASGKEIKEAYQKFTKSVNH